jgi:Tol biopolymer transport system component
MLKAVLACALQVGANPLCWQEVPSPHSLSFLKRVVKLNSSRRFRNRNAKPLMESGYGPLLAVALALCVGAVPLLLTLSLPPPGYTPATIPYTMLTFGSWDDVSPTWSPDGTKVAFATNRDGGWGIRVINPDGSNDRRLTSTKMVASNPSWSPDSSSIAFWSSTSTGTDVRLAFLRNSTILALTNGGYSVLEGQPKWSPDGTRLLFFAKSATTQLMSVDVGTKTSSVLAPVNGSDISASWISNTEVAYSTYEQGSYEICKVSVTEGTEGCIWQKGANYTSPAVSPDASRLAYISDLVPANPYGQMYPSVYSSGDFNLWVSDLDGSNATFQSGPTPIEHASAINYRTPFTPGTIDPARSLAWSPNGNLVAYTAFYLPLGSCIYLWDVSRWTSTMAPLGPLNASVTSLSWGPSNVGLVFAAVADGHYHVYALNYPGPIMAMPAAERQ